MQISPIQYRTISNTNRNKSNNQPQISFKQVTPEHFFIKMSGYRTDYKWGNFVFNLANSFKNDVLKNNSKVDADILILAKKYHIYKITEGYPRCQDFGTVKGSNHYDLAVPIDKDNKFGEYYAPCLKTLKDNKENLTTRVVSNLGLKIKRRFKAFQVQKEVDGKNVVLTQIGYLIEEHAFKDSLYLIHPPYNTAEILIQKSQKILDDLKQYKSKKLTEKDTTDVYEKIGAIHWCLAQGMPFQRGSAALADIYTKSLFEALNIQTTPWKKNLSPDWEAFITPVEEYSKKYRSFFK